MTIIDDLANSVEAYPTTEVELEIVAIDLDEGDNLNVNEVVRFRVKVTNNGALTMTDVRVKVVAENGARVKSGSALDQLGPDAVDSTIIDRINAHGGSEEGGLFTLEAPSSTKPVGTTLATATLEEWNGLFDHLLDSHSRAATTPSVTFESKVFAGT